MEPLKSDWFLTQVPGKPMGRYAHIVLLRVTDSYPLFQTDGELNTSHVQAGVRHREPMTRLAIFKRKQSTPERLVGRELLRRYGFLSCDPAVDNESTGADGLPICDYNVKFCTRCPDCITYGFAIGDSGSEKSKVITDTAYSLTSYDHSHEAFTLNAPFEDGTMSRHGTVNPRINEQDHVQPQVIFPGVVTTRDLTEPLFLYVLNNVLRTRRYGAQTTRTGRLRNQVVGIVLADGEIFSNLLFTQRLYDCLQDAGAIHPPDPVDVEAAMKAAQTLLPELLQEDNVRIDQLLMGDDLATMLQRMADQGGDGKVQQLLSQAFADSSAYHETWIAKPKKK